MKEEWCILPKANAAFVCQMEDVLEVYNLPYNPNRPVICTDEMPKQLLADRRDPLPAQAETPARRDYEYKRNVVADLIMLFEPLAGKRFVEITEKRRKVEWATVMKQVSDVLFLEAEKIIVVLHNLDTHTPSAFYETFEPQEPDGWWNDLNSTLHPSMAVGSIWLRLNRVPWYGNAWTGESQTRRHSPKKCRLGNSSGMTRLLRCYGNLLLWTRLNEIF